MYQEIFLIFLSLALPLGVSRWQWADSLTFVELSFLCHSYVTFCHISETFCHHSSTLCHLSETFWHLSEIFCLLSETFCLLSETFCCLLDTFSVISQKISGISQKLSAIFDIQNFFFFLFRWTGSGVWNRLLSLSPRSQDSLSPIWKQNVFQVGFIYLHVFCKIKKKTPK